MHPTETTFRQFKIHADVRGGSVARRHQTTVGSPKMQFSEKFGFTYLRYLYSSGQHYYMQPHEVPNMGFLITLQCLTLRCHFNAKIYFLHASISLDSFV